MGECPTEYPLQKKRHTLEFLRGIAHLRPRTNTIAAVARVRSALAQVSVGVVAHGAPLGFRIFPMAHARSFRLPYVLVRVVALLIDASCSVRIGVEGGYVCCFLSRDSAPRWFGRQAQDKIGVSKHAKTCALPPPLNLSRGIYVSDIHTHCSLSISPVQATHDFFRAEGFLYLQSPIITASDCEGAGEMFRVTTLPSEVCL